MLRKSVYISVLVGCDRYELVLREGEDLSPRVSACVLNPVVGHFNDVKPRLVLV